MNYLSFCLGVFSIIIQTILLRQIYSNFYGNELCVSFGLSVWMICFALGSYIGSFFKKITEKKIIYILLVGCLYALISGWLLSWIRYLLPVSIGEYLNIFQLFIIFGFMLFVPCLLMGMAFTFITFKKINEKGEPAANVYFWESLGSFIGGCVTSFVLVKWLSNSQILMVTGCVFSIFLLFKAKGLLRFFYAAFFLLIICFSYLGGMDRFFESIYWKSFLPGSQVVSLEHDKYGKNTIIKWGGEYFLYSNGHRVSTIPDSLSHQALSALILSQHKEPHDVLLVGGGLGGLAPELARYPLVRTTYIELDENAFQECQVVLSQAEQENWKNKNLSVRFADGYHVLKNESKKYDIITICLGQPMSAFINRYYTREFFQLVSARLNENGVFVICNFPSSENYLDEESLFLNQSVFQTLKMVFNHVLVLPGDAAVYFATNSEKGIVSDTELLTNRYNRFEIHQKYFNPVMFQMFYFPDRLESLNKKLAGQQFGTINLATRPTNYIVDFLHWIKLTTHNIKNFRKILTIRPLWGWSVFLLLGTLWMVISLLYKPARNTGTAIIAAIVGFTGISLQISLILLFQIVKGFLYNWLGFLFALFMLGTALSVKIINNKLDVLSPVKGLLYILSGFVIFSILLLFITTESDNMNYIVFLFFIFGSGALTGAAFPLLCRLNSLKTKRAKLGAIYASDLAGASIGAFLVSGFFIPVWGIFNTLSLNVIMALFCILYLTFVIKK